MSSGPRIYSRKRLNRILKYDELKFIKRGVNKEYCYYVEDLDNYYSINEMLDFKECNVDKTCLIKRIFNLKNRFGRITTLKEAIMKPLMVNNTKKTNIEYKISKRDLKEIEDNKLYNNITKLMKPGSLANEARVMQSYELGEIK